jgi:type I restriction enzyme S subunit
MKQFVAKAGDLIVSCAGTIGEIYELPQDAEEGVFNQALMRVQVNDEAVNKEIFITVFSSMIDKFSKIYSNGSAIKNIPPFADLKKTQVFLPCKEEQKKIAKLLALLDERIVTQNKIIDKLQSLIKGIVDSTILRKEKSAIVGDVCSISEQIRAEANIDDIITVRLHGNGVCKSSAENLQLGATQYYRRRAGQLIYGKQNFHNGAIGIVPISLDNGITSKDIPSFDIDEMKCNSVYLLAQLQSPQYYKPAEALTTGTGSKRLKEETFLKMPIVLPNKREQDNIATLIISISANLDQAKKMLDLFSIQKQYLLRQMFI